MDAGFSAPPPALPIVLPLGSGSATVLRDVVYRLAACPPLDSFVASMMVRRPGRPCRVNAAELRCRCPVGCSSHALLPTSERVSHTALLAALCTLPPPAAGIPLGSHA